MNSIHERHVPSQEKPKSTNHTFSKIKTWRKNRKPKINYISCHHIFLVTRFPMSQEFCNYDFVWESYANFSEDAQNFILHKVSHFSPRVAKILRELMMNKWNFDMFLECENVFKYTFKWTYLMLAYLSSKVRIFINLNFIFDFKLLTTSMVNLMYFYYFSYHINGQPYVILLFSYHLNSQPYVFLLFFF